jgi:deazaflavin-dependent oxidoreductase (nitroreductase family)
MLVELTVRLDRTIGRRLYRVHRFIYKWTGGLIGHRSLAGPMLLLTTVGRKSGQRRINPLLYMPDGTRFLVVGSNGGRPQPPAWLLNLSAQPTVDVQVGRRKFQTEAAILTGEEKAEVWPRMCAHYKGWGLYEDLTDRELKVVGLDPMPASAHR